MDILLHNDKFKRIIFKKYYLTKINKKNMTIRNLLTYYLSLACMKYDNEAKLDRVLSEFYDSRFSVGLQTIGTYSVISYNFSVVDPKYIKDPNYNLKKIEELFNELLKPVIINNNFDDEIFKEAKEMYESNLLYDLENDSKISYQKTIHYYFNNTIRDYNLDGTLDELKKITKKKLYNYYLKMLENEHASFVLGNVVDEISIKNESTLVPHYNHFFKKRIKTQNMIIENANTKQTYLNIIYDIKLFSNSKYYYAASFLNYLFGSSSESKLFQIVREKYGLCYSISSKYLGATGIILLQAIINKKDLYIVLEKINDAFNELLDSYDLDLIKNRFIDSIYADSDYLESKLSNYFLDTYFPSSIKTNERIEKINNVKEKDLKYVKNRMKPDFIFVYGGDINE